MVNKQKELKETFNSSIDYLIQRLNDIKLLDIPVNANHINMLDRMTLDLGEEFLQYQVKDFLDDYTNMYFFITMDKESFCQYTGISYAEYSVTYDKFMANRVNILLNLFETANNLVDVPNLLPTRSGLKKAIIDYAHNRFNERNYHEFNTELTKFLKSKKSYNKCYKIGTEILQQRAKELGAEQYEIIESSDKYPHELTLITYVDKEHELKDEVIELNIDLL